MQSLRYLVVFLMAFYSLWLSAASMEVALGPVVNKQQTQDGSYWIQLVAVKKVEAVERVKKSHPNLNIVYHTDQGGLKRVLAGPYESYQQADSVRRQMGMSNAFVRFIKKLPVAMKPQSAEAATQNSQNPVTSFIDQEKQQCSEAATQRQSASDADCVCCLHIRNNTLIRH